MSNESLDTKQRIIAVSLKLFREFGYDNVTLKDICEKSGVSKNTFYYHLKSKDDILAAFRDFPRNLHAERLHDILNAENYFEQYMELISNTAEHFQNLGVEITRRILISGFKDENKIKNSKPKELAKLELSVIKKAQEAGEIQNKSDAFELMHIGFSLILSNVMFWVFRDGDFDLKTQVRKSLEAAFDVKKELRVDEQCIFYKTEL